MPTTASPASARLFATSSPPTPRPMTTTSTLSATGEPRLRRGSEGVGHRLIDGHGVAVHLSLPCLLFCQLDDFLSLVRKTSDTDEPGSAGLLQTVGGGC